MPFLTEGFRAAIRITSMPTYEYVCEKCGHQFEKVQPISAKPLQICPEDLCAQKRWGRGKVKRAISAGGGLIFKGSGFYTTDYRSEKYKAAAKKDSAPATSSAGEAKPASPGAVRRPEPNQKTNPAKSPPNNEENSKAKERHRGQRKA